MRTAKGGDKNESNTLPHYGQKTEVTLISFPWLRVLYLMVTTSVSNKPLGTLKINCPD